MTGICFPRTPADLKPGDHLCFLYETEEEHRAALTPFLRQGLEQGEKVLYIVDNALKGCDVDSHTAETVLRYLRDDGLDVQPYLARGQMCIVAFEDIYVRKGGFDPDRVIALLQAEAEQALTEGYSALRVTEEMTWALKGLSDSTRLATLNSPNVASSSKENSSQSERLIEYGARLNDFLSGSRCLILCQYDRRRFDPEALLDVLYTHPIVMVGSEVYDNSFYIQPAELLGPDPPAVKLRHRIQNLVERRRAEEALRKRTRDLDERVKELNCLYAIAYLVEQSGISLEDILQGVVDLIPPAWQYPEITCARIVLEGKTLKTNNFKETNWKQSGEIVVRGNQIGTLDVCHLEEKPERDEGPFLHEERSLLDAIAERVGRIIERRRAEEALREAEELLHTVVTGAPIILFALDREGVCTFIEGQVLLAIGLEPDDLLGRPVFDVFPGLSQLKERFHRALAGESSTLIDEMFERTLESRLSPLLDPNGQTVGVIGVFTDITERTRTEEVLRRTESLAAMGRMAAALAHEINNPLQAIRSNLELVLDFALEPGDDEEYLQVCRQEIERLIEIAQRVLSFARPSRDKRHPASIADLMQRTLALVSKQLQHAQVQVTTDLPAGLPSVLVAPDQIVQVLLNIMINATEVMPEGGFVHAKARVEEEMLVLTLTNDGPPIPPKHIDQIFDPFFTTKPDGTGLGLSTSYSIVQAHGGTIHAENLNDDRGVRFGISLPIAPRAEAGDAQVGLT